MPVDPRRLLGDDLDAADLQAFSFAWSADVSEYFTLDRWLDDQDDDRTAFDRAVREFRQERPWLRADVDPRRGETFGYRHPTEGTVLYYALRRDPEGDEDLLVACNVEGTPVDVDVDGILAEVRADLAGEPAAATADDAASSGDGVTSSGDDAASSDEDWYVALAPPSIDAESGDSAAAVTLATADAIVWRR